MNSPIEAIKRAVAENRASDALSRLLELSQNNKQLHYAIHIVLAEFNDLTSQRLKGTIDNSEATRRLNVIHDKILIALGAFDSAGRVLPGSPLVKRNLIANTLWRLMFAVLGIGVVLYFVFKATDNREIEMLSYIILAIGVWVFFAYLLAMVVSAFKK